MPSVDLTSDEWGQLMNVLATTKEHAWIVTNPLLMKIGQQLNKTTVQQAAVDQQVKREQAAFDQARGFKSDVNSGKEVHHE